MNDLHELPFDAFKQGQSEAFRHYFHLHNYRIYCYLLRISRDRDQAKELTQNAFIVLFRSKEQIKDEEHLLRRLYLSSRVGYLLRLKEIRSSMDLETELTYHDHDDNNNIMDDPDVARNETLIALQVAMQKLPPAKREVAELYFFQGLSVSAIAKHLGLDEQLVREYISQSLKRLGEELSGKGTNKNNFSVIKA